MSVILAKNPIQGGSVVVRLSFRDESGQGYVPVEDSVYFVFLALNTDKETWDVVKSWTAVTSASVVDLVLQGQDLELLPDCLLKRRVIIQWKYLRGGEEVLGRDSVDFDIVPLPLTDPPLGPPPLPPVPDP
jgi:hypothetical protein